jgi:hypothetical protein
MIILLVQFVIFMVYIIFIYTLYGVLPSISASWYLLPKRLKILFYIFCVSIGILTILHGSIYFFLSGAGLIFTGTASAYKSKDTYTNIVHFSGAAVCILFALLGLWVESQIIFPSIILTIIIAALISFRIKNYIWWVELSAFLLLIAGLFYKYIV